MTAEVVNLRRARKQKLRADKDSIATANRARFGRTGAERDATAKEDGRQSRLLDGHLRTFGEGDGG